MALYLYIGVVLAIGWLLGASALGIVLWGAGFVIWLAHATGKKAGCRETIESLAALELESVHVDAQREAAREGQQ